MRLHVIREMVLSRCPVRTLWARKRLDPRMSSHVVGQIALPRRSVRAHGAGEWPLAVVGAHVNGQVALLCRPVWAPIACVWLDPRVNPHVLCKATFACSLVITNSTRIHWLDACVRAHVPRQVALVLRRVRAHGEHVHNLWFRRRVRGVWGALLCHGLPAGYDKASPERRKKVLG